MDILKFAAVAFLWGSTNPFLKAVTTRVEVASTNSKLTNLLLDIYYLFTNWRYLFFLTLNQLGSLIYVLNLQNHELSYAGPVTNALTFLVTALTGILMGERKPNNKTMLGMIFILVGTSVCWYGKSS